MGEALMSLVELLGPVLPAGYVAKLADGGDHVVVESGDSGCAVYLSGGNAVVRSHRTTVGHVLNPDWSIDLCDPSFGDRLRRVVLEAIDPGA